VRKEAGKRNAEERMVQVGKNRLPIEISVSISVIPAKI
jgi:hypothetical protein